MSEFHVAIAEDNPQMLNYLNDMLEQNGFRVVGKADNGVDAYDMIVKTEPDLVLMDAQTGWNQRDGKDQEGADRTENAILYYGDCSRKRSGNAGCVPSWRQLFYYEAVSERTDSG